MAHVLRIGIDAYIEEQLHPESIDDSAGEAKFLPRPRGNQEPIGFLYRWYTRMAYSRRQLLEKMTLIWHEHFAVSGGKVLYLSMLRDYEQTLRDHALGNFRDLLVAMTKDNAMLRFLDNDRNNGQAVDGEGQRIPPNENYARELMQLFALGTEQLNMDGTPILSPGGLPLPTYTEHDVREVARALTGWETRVGATFLGDFASTVNPPAAFVPASHDPGEKTILGETIAAGLAEDGAREVDQVIDILMRQPTMAPFIAKQLISKLATETPAPDYVERVATVFAETRGDIRATVRAVLTDDEFFGDDALLSQHKEPVELLVGAVRALRGRTGGKTLHSFCTRAGQSLWFPPSVFSFYRPGARQSLVNPALAAVRDQAVDAIANGATDGSLDTTWNARLFLRRYRLAGEPEKAVDLLASLLLAAPLRPEARAAIVDYVGSEVTVEKIRGAAWLVLTTPEFQRN